MSIGRLRPDCSPVAATTFQYAEKDDWRGDAKNSVSQKDSGLERICQTKLPQARQDPCRFGSLVLSNALAIPEKIDVRASHEEEVPFAGMVRQSRQPRHDGALPGALSEFRTDAR